MPFARAATLAAAALALAAQVPAAESAHADPRARILLARRGADGAGSAPGASFAEVLGAKSKRGGKPGDDDGTGKNAEKESTLVDTNHAQGVPTLESERTLVGTSHANPISDQDPTPGEESVNVVPAEIVDGQAPQKSAEISGGRAGETDSNSLVINDGDRAEDTPQQKAAKMLESAFKLKGENMNRLSKKAFFSLKQMLNNEVADEHLEDDGLHHSLDGREVAQREKL